MRMEKMFFRSLREDPNEAETASHKFLLRGDFIKKTASGVYSYMPMGLRVIKNIEKIVRDVMDEYGAQEISMSILQPSELWKASGRWDDFGPEMFKLKDRNEREFCLGPTAEEYFTTLVKDEISSYRKLPLNIYQIGNKYRDEKRPRFGVNRAREFIMKDAYSFDIDEEGMRNSYMNMWRAYEEIFDRIGLEYRIVAGDSGAMGGNSAHEFTALSDVGEGVICYCKECSYAATDEKASVKFKPLYQDEEEREKEKVATPNTITIEDLSRFLGSEKDRCVKAVDLKVQGKNTVVFIPGSRDLNMSKLISYLKVPEHEIEMMNDEDIKASGSYPGYTGPMGLKDVRIIADRSVSLIKNMTVGANQEGCHIINVNYGRDFEAELADDLLMIKGDDLCPECEGKLEFKRGIEVGNIFQLGKKYSRSLDACFLDENGKSHHYFMGSYGIGISRILSAVIEQFHDEKGMIWPLSLAPYKVMISVINVKDEEQLKKGEELYEKLKSYNIDCLLDDRNERAGVKFNDRDLIGIPLRITVGKKACEDIVEFSNRKDCENIELKTKEAIDKILKETGMKYE